MPLANLTVIINTPCLHDSHNKYPCLPEHHMEWSWAALVVVQSPCCMSLAAVVGSQGWSSVSQAGNKHNTIHIPHMDSQNLWKWLKSSIRSIPCHQIKDIVDNCILFFHLLILEWWSRLIDLWCQPINRLIVEDENKTRTKLKALHGWNPTHVFVEQLLLLGSFITGERSLLPLLGQLSCREVSATHLKKRQIGKWHHDAKQNDEHHEILNTEMNPSGGRLNKKDGLTRYGDSHVKDKTS